ncbi:MAG TPA: zf-HC2 domain-containing protein [bacterium]|nr:zf-HC2 domain-containing protein [bacterium]
MWKSNEDEECGIVAPLLTAYVESALPPVMTASVKAHLETCANCREEKKRIEAVLCELRSLSLLCERAPGEAVVGNLLREAEKACGGKGFFKRIMPRAPESAAVISLCRKLGAAAACLSIAFGGMIYFHLSKNNISGELVSADSQSSEVVSLKSANCYPYSVLSESENTFLNGDAAQAMKHIYTLKN